MSIADNVKKVRETIEEYAFKAGRNPDEITLVGVTKSSDGNGAQELVKCGVTNLAENRVQMLKEKQAVVTGASWNLIGHLQTNKVKDVCGRVALIQSLDSIKLAEEIDRISKKNNIVTECLCEVNIFKEESKSGIFEENVNDFLAEAERFENIKIKGFMSMAPVDADEITIRRGFEKMNKIFIDNRGKKLHNVDASILSMGMSRDFQYAILEGATMVRVGRRLFA